MKYIYRCPCGNNVTLERDVGETIPCDVCGGQMHLRSIIEV